jgi:pre-mRNA-splicing helicase BRR2
MELSQMIVQACSVKDSQLYQLPFFDQELVERCKKQGINDIGDLLNMEPEPREALLSVQKKELSKIADVANKIPNYSIEILGLEDNKTEATTGESVNLIVEIKDDDDEGEEEEEEGSDKIVYAPFYPKEKHEQWWIVVGDEREKTLLGIKRINAKSGGQYKVSFTPRDKGNKKFTVFLICDSYIGCDVTENFDMMVYDP